MATKQKSSRGILFLTLFALPFFGVGCFMGYLAVRSVTVHVLAQRWAEVPATIRQLDLKTHSDSDGSTHKVTCTYTYRFDGREYQSDRVGLSGGSDNIGDWQQDTHRRLSAARSRRQTVPCFVNPADPSQALLDRDIRFPLLAFYLVFVTVFGGVGIGLLTVTHLARRQERRRRERLAEAGHPEGSPWLMNDRWAGGIIRPTLATRRNWFIATAVFICAIWLPLLAFLPRELARGNTLSLIALIGPLIGLLLAVWAIRLSIRYRKFGRSTFECRPLPGVIGGHLRGELILAGEITTLEQIDVTLKCVNTLTTRSGNSSSTSINTLWDSRQTLTAPAARFGDREMRLPIAFQIPHSCRPSNDEDANDKVEWKLLVRATAAGVDLVLDFEVPVFRTEQSNETIGESPEVIAREEAIISADDPPPSVRIRREVDHRGNTVLVSSCWPGLGMATILFLFALLCTGVAGFTGYGVVQGNWFLILFVLVFGLVALLLWWVFLSFFGSFRVVAGEEGIQVRRQCGPFARSSSLTPAEGVEFSFKESASSGARKWHAVYAMPARGRRIQLAGMIEGATAAKWFIRQIEAALARSGRPSSRSAHAVDAPADEDSIAQT